jgi:REP element-mobilizing transposase RayT
MSRGIERREIFASAREYAHFTELLEEMVCRYRVILHGYVLMPNHYHLLMQTPEANLSRAMQWLKVSYGIWFNRKQGRVGPLFQGRFKSVPVESDGSWALELSRYMHLNPVRVKDLGLGKSEKKTEAVGLVVPSEEQVRARLEALRTYRWSSYGAYAGYVSKPDWLTCQTLWSRLDPKGRKPPLRYRKYVEAPLRGGAEELESFGDRLKGAMALGSESFIWRLRGMVKGNPATQPALRQWKRTLPFERVMAAVESVKGERWAEFARRHGDEARDVALWLGRKHCGLTLAELGQAADGIRPAAAGSAIRWMDRRLAKSGKLKKMCHEAEIKLLQNET